MSQAAEINATRLLADAVLRAVGLGRIGVTPSLSALIPWLRAAGAAADVIGGDEPLDAAVIELSITDEPGGPLPLPPAAGLFVVARGEAGRPVARAAVEAVLLQYGYRKHPATTALFGFEALGDESAELWAVFERAQATLTDDETRLRAERDLHADMLREPGVRSDAHLVRYELAARLVRPNDVVVDAACGLGYGSYILASLSEASRVIGIDGSEWAVAYASRQYGGPRIAFQCGFLPAALATFDDSSVDCIVSLETLEHVEDPPALIRGFARVLRPGGRLFVSVPNDWADETGRDPNPHHLHVYDWPKLRQEIGQHFIIDGAWRLIASGCKSGDPRVWVPRARLLEAVPVAEAGGQDAEWWLASAVKSPLGAAGATYRQTVHGDFHGRSHLVDFDRHYTNPWVVHSLVEIPWRVQDRGALRALAQQLSVEAPPGSADAAAALAVLGWRLVEDGFSRTELSAWLRKWRTLRPALAADNPHALRWRVSLDFLAARLHELDGDDSKAARCYEQVLAIDVLAITPTLGTKSTEAAFRLGVLHWTADRSKAARDAWRMGVQVASACLHEDWIEFVGNAERPFPSSLNDAIEILDIGVRCALALRVTSYGWPRAREGRELAELRNRSLRSAVARLQGELKTSRLALRRIQRALAETQQLAGQRAQELAQAVGSLASTQSALEEAQALAKQRYAEIVALSQRLDETQSALEETQRLAVERAGLLDAAQAAVAAERTARERAEAERAHYVAALEELREASARTQRALEEAQTLARERYSEIEALSSRLAETQRALDRLTSTRWWRLGAPLRWLAGALIANRTPPGPR